MTSRKYKIISNSIQWMKLKLSDRYTNNIKSKENKNVKTLTPLDTERQSTLQFEPSRACLVAANNQT